MIYKFHKLGTKHETYVNRFLKKWSQNKKITFNKIDKNNIQIFSKENQIDKFTSESTFNQFIIVSIAFGFLKENASGYEIAADKFDFKKVTESIFKKSTNKKIQRYKDSRKICFLQKLNLIDQQVINDKKLTKTRGKLTIKDIASEESLWESEATNDFEKLIFVIERIKNEYKI